MAYLIRIDYPNGGHGYLAADGTSGPLSAAKRFESLAFATRTKEHVFLPARVVYAATLKAVGEPLSIGDIKAANERVGNHFFEKGTLNFFSSRILMDVFNAPDGIAYFVTSERGPNGRRAYSLRSFSPETGSVRTVGEFQGYATRAQAIGAAKRASLGRLELDK